LDPVVALAADHLPQFLVRARLEVEAAAPAQQVRSGSVAVIPMHGVLMPRGGRSIFGSWQGMDSLRSQVRAHA
ncbi:hypothetical protein, partial [Klebsiella aerogenes]|uniref:hypothetical protein n=1 Tax=Klebsiella aerogenes TaxID=548 RepID=UPI001952FCF5